MLYCLIRRSIAAVTKNIKSSQLVVKTPFLINIRLVILGGHLLRVQLLVIIRIVISQLVENVLFLAVSCVIYYWQVALVRTAKCRLLLIRHRFAQRRQTWPKCITKFRANIFRLILRVILVSQFGAIKQIDRVLYLYLVLIVFTV